MYFKGILLINILVGLSNGDDFLIDQRFKEQNKIKPPPNPFFNTFYDKSYYLTGSQRPIYHVCRLISFYLNIRNRL